MAENHFKEGERLLTPKQAGELLGFSPSTLAQWRCYKTVDVPYVKMGSVVRYKKSDITKFIEDSTVSEVK